MSDDVQTVSPSLVEQQMVSKSLQEDPTGLPVDKAAAFFGKHVEVLQNLVDNMSHRALRRMIMHVATKNLNKVYNIKKGTDEEKASYHFEEAVWARMIMQLHVESEKAEKALNEDKNLNLSLTKGDTNGTEEIKAE